MIFTVKAKNYIDRATYLAKRSPQKRFLTGGVLVRKEVVLAEGWSHISDRNLRETYSIHAEMHSLERCRHLDLAGADVFISTISRKSGNITLAKPCITCAIALLEAGVKRAFFTIDNKTYDWIDLKDLDSLGLYRASPGLAA